MYLPLTAAIAISFVCLTSTINRLADYNKNTIGCTGLLIINGAVITNGVAAGESNAAWQHLRLAGLVNGDLSTVVRSLNPEPTPFGSGSNFAIVGAVAGTGLMGWGAGASGFCGSLPAKAAEQLDRQLDDGNPQGGNIRANAPNAAPNQAPVAAVATTANYVDSPAAPWYTVCKKF